MLPRHGWFALLAAVWLAVPLQGGEPRTPGLKVPNLDVPLPTLGGWQFWTDELFFHKWRIQRNASSGVYRLLDARDFQHARGSFDACRAKLEEIKREKELPPMRGTAVVVLHGLLRSRGAMAGLCEHLERQGKYSVCNMGYASGQHDVAAHARALDRVLQNLDGVEEIHLVAHSMGNIVVRHYLHDRYRDKDRPADPRIKRFVMLAPPNHGSLLAYVVGENKVFAALAGEAGQQLGRDWAKIEARLATPKFEFGVIAGGRGNGKGYNPLLPGDDDGTVTVAGTRLSGARDFVVVPVLHGVATRDPRVADLTLSFLQHGHFVSEEARQPIP